MPIESIQDILNDMRDRARREREGNGSTSGYAIGTMLRQFANRIDTATSRECDRCFINHMTADDSPDELTKDEKVSTSRAHSDSVTTGVETVEDVVSEMSNARKFDKDIQDWADRIDAAHKREKAVTDALLACKDKMFPHPDPEHAPPPYPGNAAAMRAALESIIDIEGYGAPWIEAKCIAQKALEGQQCTPPPAQERPQIEQPCDAAALRAALEDVVKYLGDIIPTHREVELVKSARAALSAPPRNCDRYRTEADAEAAFDRFCMKARTGECKPWECPLRSNGGKYCYVAWLLGTVEGGAS